uniref:Uncharacterized protein n=1 Tax=Salix viminalis TaxID=40686 RepID=A0A6N2MGK8_SALVM
MQKRRWNEVGLMRKVLSCAICTIAMMSLLSVHLHKFPHHSKLSDPYRLPNPQIEIRDKILGKEQEQRWTREFIPPNVSLGPLSSQQPVTNRDYMPCTQPTPNYTVERLSFSAYKWWAQPDASWDM